MKKSFYQKTHHNNLKMLENIVFAENKFIALLEGLNNEELIDKFVEYGTKSYAEHLMYEHKALYNELLKRLNKND